MAAISKTSKAAEQVFANATECYAHTESGYFRAEPCEVKWAKEALYGSRNATLRGLGDGRYTVRVHSNEWYDIKSA